MKRIGFFAGAFDPIHDGHLEVARSAVNQLGLDALYFMVEKQPWGNKQPLSAAHRKKMVTLATEKDDKISHLDGVGDHFTIESTLSLLKKSFETDELYFIFGADVFLNMNSLQWPGLDKLLEHYIVVFERGGISEKEISEHAKSLGIVTAIIPSTHPDHSSTNVRLKPHSKTVWVPEAVADYIDRHGLYN